MAKNVPGAELPSVLGLRMEREFAIRALELAGVLLAFGITYAGVQLLEGQQHITRGVIYFVVATIILVVVTWRVRQSDESASLTLPALNSSTLRQPRQLARDLAASWQAIAWWWLLIAAIGLGFAFRLYEIASEPSGIWFDEAQNGLVARQILHGEHPIFVSGQTQLPALFFYAFAAALRILGDNVTSLRAVTTLAGVLNVIFVYLLARELFDHRVGVLSAFFLAVMRWHVNFSRFATHGIFAPLFMVATFYFLVRGLKGNGRWNFAAAGVMAAVGLQGYYGFILVPVVIVLYLAHHMIFERVLPWARLVTGLRIFAVAAIIVYAPLGDWAIHHWDQFNARTNTVSITKGRSTGEALHVAFESTKKHLLMFNSRGDRNGRHNIPGEPMLDTYTGFLFVLGVGYALWRVKSSPHFLLLIWAAITLQSGIWSVDFEAPQAYRTVAITPAIAMLAALPLAELWRVASARVRDQDDTGDASRGWRTRSELARTALLGVTAAVTIFLLAEAGTTNFHDYFDVQLVGADAWRAFNTDITLVAQRMSGAEKNHKILISSLFLSPVITYVDPSAGELSQYQMDLSRDVPFGGDRPTLVLLDATKQPDADWIKTLYPAAAVTAIRPPGEGAEPVVYQVDVPADAIVGLQGVRASYERPATAPVTRREPKLDFDWLSPPPPLPFPFHARWSGVIRFSDYQSHVLSVVAPGAITLRIDGQEVGAGNGRVDFASPPYRGLRTISIDANIDSPGEVVLLDQGQPVAAGNLFSGDAVETRHGLVATFYHNTGFSGPPAFQQLDPFVAFYNHEELPFGSNFSATWKGRIDAPETGLYTFFLAAVDTGSLLIDGQVVVDVTDREKQLTLAAGTHDIEVRMRNVGGYAELFLRWQLPSGAREIIPSDRLTP
ncbi:MAG: PA14 domain-containing protein [Chloroflexota bacterium]|nr:PA14 domain-containing protein [Chloroflexota bacterium]